MPANSVELITASAQVDKTSSSDRVFIRICSSDGVTTNGSSSAITSTSQSTRLSTQAAFSTASQNTRVVQIQSSVAATTIWHEVSQITISRLADGNFIT